MLFLSYHSHLRLQFDAQSLVDLLADVCDQLEGFSCGTAPEVYEVIGVDFGDLDLAYPGAFQAGGLYHAAGEVSGGTFEGRAATRPVRGAVHALGPELLYAGLQFRRIAGPEGVARPEDDRVGVFVQGAVAVGEVEFCGLHPDYLVIPEHICPVEDFGRLGAVGAGVHVDCAADGAGNACCELQSGEAAARRGVGEHGVEHPGVGSDLPAFDLDVGQGFGEADGESPYASVSYEHVRAPAENRQRDTVFCRHLGGFDQLVCTARFEQGVGGASYLPGRVAFHGFVELGRREEPV